MYYKIKKSRSRVAQVSVLKCFFSFFFQFRSLYLNMHCVQAVIQCYEPQSKHTRRTTWPPSPRRRRPVYTSDTEIMFKNDSPVAVPVECDRNSDNLKVRFHVGGWRPGSEGHRLQRLAGGLVFWQLHISVSMRLPEQMEYFYGHILYPTIKEPKAEKLNN